MNHVTLAGLPVTNLRRKPVRTTALVIVVTMLTVAFYGGSLLSMNLEAGLNSMQERMGADLMVTPQNTKNEAEALLTNSGSSTFYFTNDIENEVSKADGIDEITAQTYISSLAAACCDDKVQIIGFNPQTDFVITPWIGSQFDGVLLAFISWGATQVTFSLPLMPAVERKALFTQVRLIRLIPSGL